jgi:putative ABC transport system permease protein
VVVTAALAQALELDTDSTIEMFIGRNIDGQDQTAKGEFGVSQVLSKDAYGRSAMFLSVEDLIAIERFRDDQNVQVETWFSNTSVPESYASFRLYAASLEGLEPLQNTLASMGIESRPRAENATLLLSFRSNLNILYFAVALLAILGFWAAMAANLRGMVERQRITFSLLDLMALPIKARFMIPIWQSMILVAGGIVATFVIVLPMVVLINVFFVTASGPFVAYLGLVDILGTIFVGAITAFSASLWALAAVRDILPEEVLRHA